MKQDKRRIRPEVVLLHLFITMILLLFVVMFLDYLPILWRVIVSFIALPLSLLGALLITNKIVTGKFTNHGKLTFDDN